MDTGQRRLTDANAVHVLRLKLPTDLIFAAWLGIRILPHIFPCQGAHGACGTWLFHKPPERQYARDYEVTCVGSQGCFRDRSSQPIQQRCVYWVGKDGIRNGVQPVEEEVRG